MNLGEQPSTSSKSFPFQQREGEKVNKEKGSFTGCPLTTSKTKKSSGTETIPPTSSKSKVKRLQRPANRRRKIQRRVKRQQGNNTQSTVNNPSTLTPAVLSEFSVFSAVHSTQIWKFAKEKGISKEIALQEFIKVFKQVSEMDPQ
ncbi:UNVERIFIED_CONTAM: hypothetical protein RMT77_000231 [Armadillidium vulgare]